MNLLYQHRGWEGACSDGENWLIWCGFGSSACLYLRGQCRYQSADIRMRSANVWHTLIAWATYHPIFSKLSKRPLKSADPSYCETACKHAKPTRLGSMPLEHGTSLEQSALLTEHLQVEKSTPAVILNSSFICNVALQLREAGINVTALDAKTPLSCCCACTWEKKCVWIFLKLYTCVFGELGFGFCRWWGNHSEIKMKYLAASRWVV